MLASAPRRSHHRIDPTKLIAPLLLAIGLVALILDLPHSTFREILYGFVGCLVGFALGQIVVQRRESRGERCGP